MLLDIMRALRDPETGCPWDVKQTFETIAPYTIEEAYEVADAIERNDLDDLKDELGDLLLQAVFHAQIASDQKAFDFGDVIEAITAKLVRRHPHVFGDTEHTDENAVKETWEQIKARERAEKASDNAKGDQTVEQPSILADVPNALPALLRAEKLQKRAARVGFDWKSADGALEKIVEEAGEIREAQNSGDKTGLEHEVGDLLFSVVNLSRHLGVDAETALRGANARFKERFVVMEKNVTETGNDMSQMDIDQLEMLWQTAKRSVSS